MRVLDLFAGIGGISLGFERAGMKTVAFCEIDPACQRVLRHHWPDVVCYPDVTKLCRRIMDCQPETEDGEVWCPRCQMEFGDCDCVGTDAFIDTHGPVDVVAGGFPCQPFSVNGKRKGQDDDRNLWPEFIRVVRELDPSWVVAENVPGAVGHILDRILADLDDAGYESLPLLVPAHLYGADHRRDRLFVIAHTARFGVEGLRTQGFEIAHALAGPFLPVRARYGFWEVEPDVRRTADGVSGRVDRLRMLGNSVTPPVAEAIGRVIMAMEGRKAA